MAVESRRKRVDHASMTSFFRFTELSRGSQGEQDLTEVDHTLPSTEEESNAFGEKIYLK